MNVMPQICYDASLQEQAKQELAGKEHLLTQTALIFSQNGKKLYERQDKQFWNVMYFKIVSSSRMLI